MAQESYCIVLIDLISLRIGENVAGQPGKDRLGFRLEPLAWKNPSFKFLLQSFSISPIPLSISPCLSFYLHTHICTCTHACVCIRTHTHTHFKAPKRDVLCIRTGSWAEKKGNLFYSKSGVPNSERRRREGVDYGRIFPASLLTLFIIFSVFVYDSC